MKFLMASVLLLSSFAAFAQKRIVSVDAHELSYTGSLVFKHDEARRGKDRDDTLFRLNLNYAQSIEEYAGLMWKGRAYINREDKDFGGTDHFESAYGAAGGLLHNYQYDDIKNSVFTGGMVGIERATYEIPGGQDDEAGFNFFIDLEAGKRWDLGTYSVANISYAPTIALTWKRYGGDIRDHYYTSGREVKFNFLKFDILF